MFILIIHVIKYEMQSRKNGLKILQKGLSTLPEQAAGVTEGRGPLNQEGRNHKVWRGTPARGGWLCRVERDRQGQHVEGLCTLPFCSVR